MTRKPVLAPEVPTMAESGLPGYGLSSWQAVFAAAGTPPAIVERLYTEIAKILKLPDVSKRLGDLGLDLSGMPPAQRAALVKADMLRLVNPRCIAQDTEARCNRSGKRRCQRDSPQMRPHGREQDITLAHSLPRPRRRVGHCNSLGLCYSASRAVDCSNVDVGEFVLGHRTGVNGFNRHHYFTDKGH